jgi:hypothetical protein
MSKIIQELESKFTNIETKLELTINYINNSGSHKTELLNKSFNANKILERYSTELNTHRDGLLKQLSLITRSEIDRVNEAVQRNEIDFNKNKTMITKFKPASTNSWRICIKKVINKEFKLGKIFSSSQLVQYQCLLGLNAVINRNTKLNDNETINAALLHASRIGIAKFLEIAKFLVETGVDVNTRDTDSKTPLILASAYGHLELAKYLVENDADANARDNNKESALIYACNKGNHEMMEFLIENGADVNAKNKNNDLH